MYIISPFVPAFTMDGRSPVTVGALSLVSYFNSPCVFSGVDIDIVDINNDKLEKRDESLTYLRSLKKTFS